MKRISPLLLLALAAAMPLAAQTAKRSPVYQQFCVTCHGEDGKAQTEEGKKKKARDLSNAKWQEKVTDDRLFGSIKRGHDEMPAFGRKISDADIKALVAEVRALAKGQ